MARSVGISQPVYCRIERGTSKPSRLVVERVARVGGVPVAELLAAVPESEMSDLRERLRKRRLFERRKATVEAIARQRLKGLSVDQIAKARGLSTQRIYSLLKGVSLTQFIAAGSTGA